MCGIEEGNDDPPRGGVNVCVTNMSAGQSMSKLNLILFVIIFCFSACI